MRKPTSVLLAASLLGTLGVLVLSSWPSVAQFAGGGTEAVEVTNTIASDTRIVGQTVDVAVTGTVALNPASLNAFLQPECLRGEPEIVAIKSTPVQLPVDAGHADPATRWTLRNLGAGNQRVCCRSSADGGVPEIGCSAPGIGYPTYPRETLIIEGTNLTHSVWCRFDSIDPLAEIEVNVWEEACTQQ